LAVKTLEKFILFCAVALTVGAAFQPAAAAPVAVQSRLGVNLAAPVDWNTEHPFVDVFRLSRAWISQTNNYSWGQGPALSLDTNGWITALETNCYVDTPMLTDGHAPSGNYVCLYDGQGVISFWGASAAVLTNTPGRIVVNVDGADGGLFLRISSVNPSNYVRNIRLLMPGAESTYLTQPYASNFLARWSAFNTVRFMGWMDINDSTQQNWTDRPRTNYYNFTDRGVPLEVIADLCNRLKANAWICLPHLASDDYVLQCATLMHNRLSPALKVYIEYSNEVWNSGFTQNAYAQQQGAALGLGAPSRPWEGAALFYSQRAVQIFQIFQQVFGGTNRLARVLAWQAAADPSYWTDGLVLSPSNAWQHADALAIAPYLTFSPSPGGSPLDSNAVTNWGVDQVLDYVQTNCLPQSLGWVTGQKAVADKYGLPLICYEAGQSLVGVGGAVGNNALTTLLETANRDPRMGAIYTNYLDAWRAAGGHLMCLFESVSAYGQYGSWGLLEAADQTSSPKFDAVVGWNAANARPFPQLKAAAPQNGSFSMQVQGEPDQSYLIQSSPDLASWQIASDTTTGTNGLAVYSVNMTSSSTQFFRASPQ
jgi:hypothetical protein